MLAHALKFTPPDGRIAVSGTRRGDRLEIAVSRTGPGTAAEEVQQMLDPSRRTPDASGRKSRGPERGLVLANALIAAQGGHLGIANSADGDGETITIDLPVRADR